jgi:hypothetical protein
MKLKEIGWEDQIDLALGRDKWQDMDQIDLALGRDKWQALVIAIMNFWV